MTPVSRIIYVGPNVLLQYFCSSVYIKVYGKELKQNRPEDGLPSSVNKFLVFIEVKFLILLFMIVDCCSV